MNEIDIINKHNYPNTEYLNDLLNYTLNKLKIDNVCFL